METLQWESIEKIAPTCFELVNDGGVVDTVRVTTRGTYQVNVSVTHAHSKRLSVVIACGQSGEETVIWPTFVQCMATKRFTSRIDRLVAFNVNDCLCVRLEHGDIPRSEEHRSNWAGKFAPANNLLMLTYVDKNMLYV
ncbi:hypothetical protein PINS_up007696 [Pythium insidiosum]|nr:hypothetical protein PINS_up007696 [Pythium insidiosum]